MRFRSLPLAMVLALALGLPASTSARPAVPGPGPDLARVSDNAIESVLAISIDGLNPSALRRLGPEGTPHLHEFIDAGASTLNARTEYEMTVTLPNHTGMVTGRRIEAATGGHGVTWNDGRRRPARVQAAAGRRISSVFTVVSDAGASTALFASKDKFTLWRRSWRGDIDRTRIIEDNSALVRALLADMAEETRAFRFLHLALPDRVGHDAGFMSTAYLNAVRQVDRLVGQIVDRVASDPELAASTAIVLTSDHGGRGHGHSDATKLHNYRVPFMVRGPGVAAGADLYDLNPDYRDPRGSRPSYARRRQPVRNGALANLSLDLLDLGSVPGSEHNRRLNLDVAPRS